MYVFFSFLKESTLSNCICLRVPIKPALPLPYLIGQMSESHNPPEKHYRPFFSSWSPPTQYEP